MFKEIACLVAGCLVGFGLFFALQSFIPEPTYPHCRDGWNSPAIGIQGACSHHGGVESHVTKTHDAPFLIGSLLAGLFTYVGLRRLLGINKTPSRSAKTIPDADDKERIIRDAIENKNKIEFQYSKKGESISRLRTIRPTRLEYIVPRRKETLCVVGHCDLRNAQRSFALMRVKDLKVL